MFNSDRITIDEQMNSVYYYGTHICNYDVHLTGIQSVYIPLINDQGIWAYTLMKNDDKSMLENIRTIICHILYNKGMSLGFYTQKFTPGNYTHMIDMGRVSDKVEYAKDFFNKSII